LLLALLTTFPNLCAVELSLSGIIGQSQPAEATPLVHFGFSGVALDGSARIWAATGTTLIAVPAQPAGAPVSTTLTLPTGALGQGSVWFDGSRILVGLADGRLAIINPDSARIERTLALPVGTTHICSPGKAGTGAARFPLIALTGRQLFGLTLAEPAAPVPLALIPDFGKTDVEAIGVLAGSGDIVVGAGYPDMRQYRFSADGGHQIQAQGWPRPGWARQYLSVGATTWMLAKDGAIVWVDGETSGLALRPAPARLASQPSNGLAAGPGGWWLASGGGLLQVDGAGKPVNRIGGLPGMTGVALGADGTLMMLQQGLRIVRMYVDDVPASAPDSPINEPWQINKGNRASGGAIASDRDGYLLTDVVDGLLWRFDPTRTAWGNQPWSTCCPTRTFSAVTGVAVGERMVRVVDDGRIREARRMDQPMVFTALDLPLPADAPPRWVAAVGDDRLIVANASMIACFERRSGSFQLVWRQSGKAVTAIAALPGVVAVAESEAVRLLDGINGHAVGAVTAMDMPDHRLDPIALTARSPWLVIADRASARMVRLRVVFDQQR